MDNSNKQVISNPIGVTLAVTSTPILPYRPNRLRVVIDLIDDTINPHTARIHHGTVAVNTSGYLLQTEAGDTRLILDRRDIGSLIDQPITGIGGFVCNVGGMEYFEAQ